MKRFSPQQQKIIDYLQDGNWHCMANVDFFMKDDRKRISELNARGYEIEGTTCDGRCKINHSARIFMRRITKRPPRQLIEFKVQSDGTRVAVETFI